MSEGMKIGLTGSRNGLTKSQRRVALQLLKSIGNRTVAEVHHGDCVGADTELAMMFLERELGTLHAHPATMNAEWDERWRARTKEKFPNADIVEYPAKAPNARNADIVDACTVLWAFPSSMDGKGGTWNTINMAIEAGRPFRIIAPDADDTNTLREEWGDGS